MMKIQIHIFELQIPPIHTHFSYGPSEARKRQETENGMYFLPFSEGNERREERKEERANLRRTMGISSAGPGSTESPITSSIHKWPSPATICITRFVICKKSLARLLVLFSFLVSSQFRFLSFSARAGEDSAQLSRIFCKFSMVAQFASRSLLLPC